MPQVDIYCISESQARDVHEVGEIIHICLSGEGAGANMKHFTKYTKDLENYEDYIPSVTVDDEGNSTRVVHNISEVPS